MSFPASLPLFLVLFLSAANFTYALPEEGRFHRVPALEGDNVYKLLKRYHLEDFQCNFQQFYELNKLKQEAQLLKGKKYYIPVLIYKYNGRSIRSTLGIEGWEQALRIKHYNEDMLKEKRRRSTLARSRIMWVPYHELFCLDNKIAAPAPKPEKPIAKEEKERPTVPTDKIDPSIIEKRKRISGARKFPIFGEKHAHVPLLDNKLRGKVFYLVSGHGGPDSGAVGRYGKHQLCEDEYAYDVTLRLCRRLLEHGAIAYMITRDPDDGLRSGEYLDCDRDEYCWGDYKIPRSQKSRLFQRSDAINTLYERHSKQGIKDQLVVVIHIDSRSKGQNTDVFFYHYPGSQSSRQVALKIHKTFQQKYRKYRANGRYNGTVTGRDLHMLRECKPQSVFIELGNIRNSADQKRFVLESNREALAKWMYEGLVR